MTWQAYDLLFQLESNLHIGDLEAGNLLQTRSYVHGKVIWAALTARLTRMLGRGGAGEAYQQIGQEVEEYFRFGYLWPTLLDSTTEQFSVCYPWEVSNFDYLFRYSFTGTALDQGVKSALEGSLHEVEYIGSRTRDGQQVYLFGMIWVNEEALSPNLSGWQEALNYLQFGGERTYGWGRVSLEDGFPMVSVDVVNPDGFDWPDGKGIPSHVSVELGRGVIGEIEPLLGWERGDQGGLTASVPILAYQPQAESITPTRFRIGKYGVWEGVTD